MPAEVDVPAPESTRMFLKGGLLLDQLSRFVVLASVLDTVVGAGAGVDEALFVGLDTCALKRSRNVSNVGCVPCASRCEKGPRFTSPDPLRDMAPASKRCSVTLVEGR